MLIGAFSEYYHEISGTPFPKVPGSPEVGSWGRGWGRAVEWEPLLSPATLFLAMASAVGEVPPLSSSAAIVAAWTQSSTLPFYKSVTMIFQFCLKIGFFAVSLGENGALHFEVLKFL